MRESYPARAEALPLARRAAVGRAEELGADESVAQAIALAVTEACSNGAILGAQLPQPHGPSGGPITVAVRGRQGVADAAVVYDQSGGAGREQLLSQPAGVRVDRARRALVPLVRRAVSTDP